MVTAADAMPGGDTSPSPLCTPVPPRRSPSPAASPSPTASPVDSRISGRFPSATMEEQGDPASGGLGQDPGDPTQPSSKKQVKKEFSTEPLSALRLSVKNNTQVTNTHPQEVYPTVRSKRSLSEASGSLRASKVAKVNNPKQSQKQTTTVGRKVPPILSGSPMINMMARKRAQSHANFHARSPSSHARSPNSSGTLKSPSLLDLSPVATRATPTSMKDLSPAANAQGSKRRPRKLTSAIWMDAEPIYIGGLLMEGK